MNIKFLKAGMFTTIQDCGRFGLAHLGIPCSGYMDVQSAELANTMLGNQNCEGLLEVTWTGVEFVTDVACSIALAGAEFVVSVNDEVVSTDDVIQLQAGDVFKMKQLLTGVRAYLSFAGGIDLQQMAGSVSTLAVAQLGGIRGRSLKDGDCLKLKQPHQVQGKKKPLWKKIKPKNIHVVRALPGPEKHWFDAITCRQAYGQAYQLTQDCNRQGFRLSSAKVAYPANYHMDSSGLVAGSLQVTPDGQTILAMKDAQTTGGYPRILVVNQNELYQLAQVRPDEIVYFFVNHDESVFN